MDINLKYSRRLFYRILTIAVFGWPMISWPASAADSPAHARTRLVRVCPTAGRNCDFTSLAQALEGAEPGGTITLAPGLYQEAGVSHADGLTLRGEVGAHIQGALAEGKAALVIKGNDTVIEGLECSEIAAPEHNGACVRLEGHNLTLRKVYFHDSEEGVLTGPQTGTVIVEDSRFERLGAGGRAHALYIGETDAVIIRRSQILSSRGEGHEVKSRAARTVIEDSIVASLDGVDSRLVDVPNGGELIVRNSILEKGVNSSNSQLIGFGLEGVKYTNNSIRIENCAIVIDRRGSRIIGGAIHATLPGTQVIGGDRTDAAEASWRPDRAAAGIPPYPSLSIR